MHRIAFLSLTLTAAAAACTKMQGLEMTIADASKDHSRALQLGRQWMAEGKFGEARAALEVGVQGYTLRQDLNLNLYMYNEGQFQPLTQEQKDVLMQFYDALGHACAAAQQFSIALGYFQQTVFIDPSNPEHFMAFAKTSAEIFNDEAAEGLRLPYETLLKRHVRVIRYPPMVVMNASVAAYLECDSRPGQWQLANQVFQEYTRYLKDVAMELSRRDIACSIQIPNEESNQEKWDIARQMYQQDPYFTVRYQNYLPGMIHFAIPLQEKRPNTSNSL